MHNLKYRCIVTQDKIPGMLRARPAITNSLLTSSDSTRIVGNALNILQKKKSIYVKLCDVPAEMRRIHRDESRLCVNN